MQQFYDGTKLLSLTDANGNKPEIYICTSNRTAGKTTYFSRWFVKRYLEKAEKFAILYRFAYELDDCADKFFKDIGRIFFNTHEMTSERRAHGTYHELFIDGCSCGYAIAINNADNIKKNSHMFSDVQRILFDEFQSETNKYCPDEIKKFMSVHTSIARGGGEQIRYVPVFMLSNPVSLINPYYVELGICSRIKDTTKFLKGDGFVLEQNYNTSAHEAQLTSGFNKAFSANKYVSYAAENVYLNDNTAFVDKVNGNGIYVATIKFEDCEYGIREYPSEGIIYCDDRPDKTHKFKIAVTTEDHNINYVMLKRNDLFLSNLRYYFERGAFRFKNLRCKDVILRVLSYTK